VGSVVEGAAFKGEIADIGLTSTRIRTDDGEMLDVPNAVFLDGPVTVHRDGPTLEPE